LPTLYEIFKNPLPISQVHSPVIDHSGTIKEPANINHLQKSRYSYQ